MGSLLVIVVVAVFPVEEDSASSTAAAPKAKSKERLVVRMDDRWVDLTGWRKAHPSGAHWIDVFKNADATEVMHAFHRCDNRPWRPCWPVVPGGRGRW